MTAPLTTRGGDGGTPAVLVITPPAPFLNSNQRLHYRQRMERTKAWRTAGREAAYDLRTSYERAHIVCAIRWPDNRRRDPGNWYPTAKAAVDGIVDAGILEDDDSLHLIGPDMRREYPNGPVRLTITIREADDAA